MLIKQSEHIKRLTVKQKPLVNILITGLMAISLNACLSSPDAALKNIEPSQQDAKVQRSELNNAPEIDNSLRQVSGGGQHEKVPLPKKIKRSNLANIAVSPEDKESLYKPTSIAAVIDQDSVQSNQAGQNVPKPVAKQTAVTTTANALAAQPKPRKRTSLFDFFSNPAPRPKAEVSPQQQQQTAKVQPVPKAKPTSTRVVKARKNTDTRPKRKQKSNIFAIFSPRNKSKVRVASLASLSRTKKNLILQTPRVKVHCFKSKLLSILQQVERRYGKRVIVTSGYRSKSANRRARGVRNSAHVHCMAADIQVPGVSKWKLASYLRTLPGRGGVGTYCHTKSVHIDVGKKRDWNWRCRKRRKRK